MTSSERPFRGPQPERAGNGGWCAGGLCSRRGRISSGLGGCDEAEGGGKLSVIKRSVNGYMCLFLFFLVQLASIRGVKLNH